MDDTELERALKHDAARKHSQGLLPGTIRTEPPAQPVIPAEVTQKDYIDMLRADLAGRLMAAMITTQGWGGLGDHAKKAVEGADLLLAELKK